MLMVNLGSTDDSRYSGFREITDGDVLDLQCIPPFLELCLAKPPLPGSIKSVLQIRRGNRDN